MTGTAVAADIHSLTTKRNIGKAADLLQSLVRSGIRKMLVSELMVHPKFRSPGMNGSGMVIINPPWQLEEDMLRLMPQWLSRLEQEKAGSWRVEWLVPE
jgi:23S rRNA (adenine2030-N6)-methyltransferase